jgi:hypothetical protein
VRNDPADEPGLLLQPYCNRRVHNRPRAVLTSLGLGERTAAREHDFIALVGRSALARAAGSMPKTMPEISSASLPLLPCHGADAG